MTLEKYELCVSSDKIEKLRRLREFIDLAGYNAETVVVSEIDFSISDAVDPSVGDASSMASSVIHQAEAGGIPDVHQLDDIGNDTNVSVQKVSFIS